MPSISSAGIGSGLDIEGIISSLMAAERLPLTLIRRLAAAAFAALALYAGYQALVFSGLA